MKNLLSLLAGCMIVGAVNAQADSCLQQYIKTPTGYLMVLRQGEDVFLAIEKLAILEKIPAANFIGMGFAGTATFGFYDAKKKTFDPREYKDVEMGSVTGSIAWSNDKPSLHIHGVATDREFKAYGGHLLAMTVGTGSMEITVIVHDQKLERKVEQPLTRTCCSCPPVKRNSSGLCRNCYGLFNQLHFCVDLHFIT